MRLASIQMQNEAKGKGEEATVRRRLNRKDSSGNSIVPDTAIDHLWISPRESRRPRSLGDLYKLLHCSRFETFSETNVNKAFSQRGGL